MAEVKDSGPSRSTSAVEGEAKLSAAASSSETGPEVGAEEPDGARSEGGRLGGGTELNSAEEPLLPGGAEEAGGGPGSPAQRDPAHGHGGVAGDGGEGGEGEEEECPVCAAPLGVGAGLHCGHAVCRPCQAAMLRRAADRTRLRCPLCRQNTPLPAWRLRRMQDDEEEEEEAAAVRHGGVATAGLLAPPPSPTPPPPTLGALELWLEERAGPETAVCGCLRFLCRRHRCCYLACSLLLRLSELTCLLLLFLPVLLLVLLFSLAGR